LVFDFGLRTDGISGNCTQQAFLPTRLWHDPARRWTAKQSMTKGQVFSGRVAVTLAFPFARLDQVLSSSACCDYPDLP